MPTDLEGLQVAILATDGVEQIELTEPMKALKAANADVKIVAPKKGTIQAMNQDVNPGDKIPVDFDLSVDVDIFRCAGAARRHDEPRQAPHHPGGRGVRSALRRQRQTHRGHLPWSPGSWSRLTRSTGSS